MKNLFFKSHLYFIFLLLLSFSELNGQYQNNGNMIADGAIKTVPSTGAVIDLVIPANVGYTGLSFRLLGGDGGRKDPPSHVDGDFIWGGGNGAQIDAHFSLGEEFKDIPKGATLRFIVGNRGANTDIHNFSGGGGGGGSAIILIPEGEEDNEDAWKILAVAGGGAGGGGDCCYNGYEGNPAGGYDIPGDGLGATACGEYYSGGGGGAFGAGTYEQGGDSGFPDGGSGGSGNVAGGWGFGGGGAGQFSTITATAYTGGGGGYSGGTTAPDCKGHGGTSYLNEDDFYVVYKAQQTGGTDDDPDAGYITYQFISVCDAVLTGYQTLTSACASENGKAEIQLTYTAENACGGQTLYFSMAGPLITYTNPTGHFTDLSPGTYSAQIATAGGRILDSRSGIVIEGPGVDNNIPIALCKNITVTLVDGVYSNNNLASLVDNNSYDLCSDNLTFSVSKTSFDCEDVGQNVVTLTVMDDSGNSGQCNAGVTVVAEEGGAPIAHCKPDYTVSLIGLGVSVPSINDGSTAGDCSLANAGYWSPTNLTCENLGETVVTLTVTDLSGLSATCSTTVTLVDATPPIVVCNASNTLLPVSLGQNGTAQIDHTYVYSFSIENCTDETFSVTPNSFSCEDIGAVVVTLTSTDEAGNTGVCTTTITVEDGGAPIAQCKNATVTLDDTGNGILTATQLDNNSADLCSELSYALSRTTFDCSDDTGPGSSNSVNLTVTDAAGNSATCTASVAVHLSPNTVPVANCKNLTVTLDENYEYSITAADINNGSVLGLCSPSMTISQSDFDCNTIGDQAVTLTITNEQGTTASCVSTVTVREDVPPVAICDPDNPASFFNLDENNIASIPLHSINNGSYDACNVESIVINPSSFDCDGVGAQVITLTITDESGNTASCTRMVYIIDNTDPVIHCQDVTIQLDENGQGAIDLNEAVVSVEDNCSIAAVNVLNNGFSSGSFDCSDLGNNQAIIVALDPTLNSDQCIINARVEDNIDPTAICKNITVQLNDNGQATVTSNQIDNGSTDNCSIISRTLDISTFDCDDTGQVLEVTMTVTDVSGLTSTCMSNVTVADPNSVCNAPPTAVCQSTTVSVDDDCVASIIASQVDNGSSDPDFDELIYTLDSEGPFGPGSYDVTLTVDDGQYTSSCTATVTVVDDTNPVAICYNPTITFNGENNIDLAITDIWDEMASSDNCGNVFFVGQDVLQLSCTQIGQTFPVLVTIEDAYGNEATCTANVNVGGLPCSWSVDPAGVGCDPGEGNYNTGNQIFTLTSNGCYDPSYYRQYDAQGFIQQDLCGDGEIISQITNLTASGWVGIAMRESNDQSAKMVQLMCNGQGLTRREVRVNTGSPAFAHMFQTQGKNWLRLARNGNVFSAYHSLDGSNWETVFSTIITMGNCIQIGLMTMNGAPSGEVIGTFENVMVNGGMGYSFAAPLPTGDLLEVQPQIDFSLYPNPATENINLQLDQFIGESVELKIFNLYGQIVYHRHIPILEEPTESLNIYTLSPGTYLVEIQTGDHRISKKLVKTDL